LCYNLIKKINDCGAAEVGSISVAQVVEARNSNLALDFHQIIQNEAINC